LKAILESASLKDLARLYEIERECFVEEAFTRKQISQFLEDYNSLSLVAREDDKLMGFIIAMISPEKKINSGHIITVDVSSSHRRRGIGKMLLEEMENVLRSKGVKASFLEVREDNVAALSLYRKLGYKSVGILENYYGKANGICLRKFLA
jgi:ribosomal-protein-alanine N-acetyltransferase